MNKKIRKMIVLAIALLAAGRLRECADDVFWRDAAIAEESIEEVGDLKLGSAAMWRQSWNTVCRKTSKVETQVVECESVGRDRRVLIAMDVPISEVVADRVSFTFHDGRLCMCSYVIEGKYAQENFAYLLGKMTQKYGEPEKNDFSAYALSRCSAAEDIMESTDKAFNPWDQRMSLGAKIMTSLLTNKAPKEMYQWHIGAHTRITMYLSKKSTFLSQDAIHILYSNERWHGADLLSEKK